MKIEFVGPLLDPSGYGNFARSFVSAMYKAKLDINTHIVIFDQQRPNLGEEEKLIKSLILKDRSKADITILNMTPDTFDRYKNPNAINIGFTMFETTHIPKSWVEDCNRMDAIFVPCKWNIQIFKDSGVTVPIYSVPPGIYPEDFSNSSPTKRINNVPESDFIFYSIFQWTERKFPSGLLRSYWSEFTGNDNVCLILKTYKANTSESEKNYIKQQIQHMKANLKLSHYPKIFFIGDLLTAEEIRDIHLYSDCFVLPHRAEGLGMPHLEAMCCGNPVIATNFSGNLEFMNKLNSYLIDYSMTPVYGMPWIPWYDGTMEWAEPSLEDLRAKMRLVYEDQTKAKKKGKKAQKEMFEKFNWEIRLENMVNILEALMNKNNERIDSEEMKNRRNTLNTNLMQLNLKS